MGGANRDPYDFPYHGRPPSAYGSSMLKARSDSSPRATRAVRGLYALADADAVAQRGLDLVDCAAAMSAAGVPYLQVRVKDRTASEQCDLLESTLKRLSSQDSPLLIMNDRADVAALVGAAGVHVGQGDLEPEAVRRGYPGLHLGCSTHDLHQLTSAVSTGCLNYVAFGPIFSTQSKKNPEPTVGLEGLRAAHQLTLRSELPLVGIGGVTRDSVVRVAMECEFVAMISLLLPDVGATRPYSAIEERCTELNRLIVDAAR